MQTITAKLANAKSSMVPQDNPDAACMDEIEKMERKSSEQCTGKPFAHHTTSNNILVDGADFDFLVRLRAQRESCMLDNMLARVNSVCLHALSRCDWRVLALLLGARVDCAVLYCDRGACSTVVVVDI